MAVRPAKVIRSSAPAQRKLGPISLAAEKLLIVGVVATQVAFGYLVYGLVSKHVLYFPHGAPPHEALLTATQQRYMLQHISFACQWFSVLLIFTTLMAIIRYYDNASAPWVAALVGASLYFGFPFLLGTLLQQYHLVHNQLTQVMVLAFGNAARLVLGAAVAWLVVLSTATMITRPGTRHRAVTVRTELGAPSKRPTSVMRNCWELTHCTGNARGICHCYRNHISCWRRGQGCFCDSTLFDRMTDGAGTWVTTETHELHTRALYLKHGGRRACAICPLYEEHQFYKYRAICWIAYPATAAILALTFPFLVRGYEVSLLRLDRFVAELSLLPSKTTSVLQQAPTGPLQWFALGCLSLLLLGYILHFIEYLVFEKKL